MSEMNNLVVNETMMQNQESDMAAKVKALTTKMAMGNGITMDDKSTIAPTELEVSRYLLANIGTVEGGQTAHDII